MPNIAEEQSSHYQPMRILSLDANGRILNWISWQDAVCLYVREVVSWTLGEPCLTIYGGINRQTGSHSQINLHPIVASTGQVNHKRYCPSPALTNLALFTRDHHICLYCGDTFHNNQLTRDHVVPLSKEGKDDWGNVVTACSHCNTKKGGRTPQQAKMPLLAIPFRPSWVEHLLLSNRNILADQMEFLRHHLPKNRQHFHH